MENIGWISVKDGLPMAVVGQRGNSDWVLAANKKGIYTGLAKYNANGKWVVSDYSQYVEDITHWMPIPLPPKQ